MSLQLPPCPASLKPIQHYLKTASEHDGRDVVISYWCRLYALQTALKLDKKSDEATMLLMALMEWLEKEKKRLSDNDAVTNDIAAQAHIENYALKLFFWADGQDRSGQFNKNVVKAFYTAGFLMDVLGTFGELTEEIQQHCKYAKWKSAYIHNCLRNGETPLPGPAGGEVEESGSASGFTQPNNLIGFEDGGRPPSSVPSDSSVNSGQLSGPASGTSFNLPSPPSGPHSYTNITPQPPQPYTPTPSPRPAPYVPPAADLVANLPTNMNGVKLLPDQISKAQKYCKWAGSALNYDDVPEAIGNLQKALKLLTTGEDS